MKRVLLLCGVFFLCMGLSEPISHAIGGFRGSTIHRSDAVRPPSSPSSYTRTRAYLRRSSGVSRTGSSVGSIVFKEYALKNLSLDIEIPVGFEVSDDSLRRSGGMLSARGGREKIEIVAHSQTCEGGLTYMQACLNEHTNADIQTIRGLLPRGRITNSGIERLPFNLKGSFSNQQLSSKNLSRVFALEDATERITYVAFFEPIGGNLWTMTLTGTPKDRSGVVGSDLVQNRLLGSIFSDQVEDSSSPSTGAGSLARRQTLSAGDNIYSPSNRSTTDTTSRKVTSQYSLVRYEAASFPISLSTQPGYLAVEDSLNMPDGTYTLKLGDTRIELSRTGEVCDTSHDLYRRCITEKAKVYEQAFLTAHPTANTLSDENVQLKLLPTAASPQDPGKMLLTRMAGRRNALLFFLNPYSQRLWKMEISAPEKNDAILNNTVYKTQLLSSIRFLPAAKELADMEDEEMEDTAETQETTQ